MPTRDELLRHYAGLSDERLVSLAVHEASQLTAEAVEVLQAELRARQLADNLRSAIAIQTTPLEHDEIEALVQRARRLPCPRCGSTAAMLNAATVGTVRSFLIASFSERDLVVGCPSCIRAAAEKADTLTAALGWWALPFGPLRAINAIVLNAKAARAATQEEPTADFRGFVTANRGAIVLQLEGAERGVVGPEARE